MEVLDPVKIYFDWNSDRKSPYLEASLTRVTCTRSIGEFKTIFGSYKLFPGDIYYWEIRICYGMHFMVGIAKEGTSVSNEEHFANLDGGYAYYSGGMLRSKNTDATRTYGSTFSTGDTIGVYLDSQKGVLSFTLNGKSLGPAFIMSELKDNVYVPAVAVLVDGETLELVQ